MSNKLIKFAANLANLSRNRCVYQKQQNISFNLRCFSSIANHGESSPGKDVGAIFLQKDVQSILRRLTGFDLDKIYKSSPTPRFGSPKYELMTDKQLQEAREKYMRRGRRQLQMPPVVGAWSDDFEVLSDDPEIAGFSNYDVVFTDVTFGVNKKDRTVVIRQPNGELRTATQEEHDNVMQIYFPEDGRMYQMPSMFLPQQMEEVLGMHKYEYLLDRACVQFEPNNPEYHRVTQRTYEHINSMGLYENLRSTRHFGGMAFYYVTHNNIDGLLRHLLSQLSMNDAGDLVLLYHTVHPSCQSAQELSATEGRVDHRTRVQAYIKHEAKDSGPLELALQIYDEKKK